MRLPLHILIVIGALVLAGCAEPDETADPGADDVGGDGTGTGATPTEDPSAGDAPPASGDANETGTDAPPAAQDASVSIQDFAFDPAELTVATGTTVTWTNNDPLAHTVTADDGTFDSGSIASGETFEYTFDEAGTFAYHCEFHPGMTATVTVE